MGKKLKALYDKAHAFWRSEETTLAGKWAAAVGVIGEVANRVPKIQGALHDIGLKDATVTHLCGWAIVFGAFFITPKRDQ